MRRCPRANTCRRARARSWISWWRPSAARRKIRGCPQRAWAALTIDSRFIESEIRPYAPQTEASRLPPIGPHRIQVTLPVQPASETSNLILLRQFQQRAQTKFHRLPLRSRAGRSQRVFHRFVVDLDVRAHGVYSSTLRTHPMSVHSARQTASLSICRPRESWFRAPTNPCRPTGPRHDHLVERGTHRSRRSIRANPTAPAIGARVPSRERRTARAAGACRCGPA